MSDLVMRVAKVIENSAVQGVCTSQEIARVVIDEVDHEMRRIALEMALTKGFSHELATTRSAEAFYQFLKTGKSPS